MTPQTAPVEAVELSIALPVELVDQLQAYAEKWDADIGWVLRRSASMLLTEEARQAGVLGPGKPAGADGRRRRASE